MTTSALLDADAIASLPVFLVVAAVSVINGKKRKATQEASEYLQYLIKKTTLKKKRDSKIDNNLEEHVFDDEDGGDATTITSSGSLLYATASSSSCASYHDATQLPQESHLYLIQDSDQLEELAWRVPESTVEERRRFLRAKNGDVARAQRALTTYMEWRQRHLELDDKIRIHPKSEECHYVPAEDRDLKDWNSAASLALVSVEADKLSQCNGHDASTFYKSLAKIRLPRIARTFDLPSAMVADSESVSSMTSASSFCIVNNDSEQDTADRAAETSCCRCREGYRIVYVSPGKLEDRIPIEEGAPDGTTVSLETYALAIALYLDRILDRNSLERVTVMIDARGGKTRLLLVFYIHVKDAGICVFMQINI